MNPVVTIGAQLVETIATHLPLSPSQAKARAIELLDDVGIPAAARRFDHALRKPRERGLVLYDELERVRRVEHGRVSLGQRQHSQVRRTADVERSAGRFTRVDRFMRAAAGIHQQRR